MSDSVHLTAEISFPIALETILSVSLDFDNLKVILEYLLSILRQQQEALRTATQTQPK
jgi:hypothetical protein